MSKSVSLATLIDDNSVLDGGARPSLQSTVGINRPYLSKLEKAAIYPGSGNHPRARQGAGGRPGIVTAALIYRGGESWMPRADDRRYDRGSSGGVIEQCIPSPRHAGRGGRSSSGLGRAIDGRQAGCPTWACCECGSASGINRTNTLHPLPVSAGPEQRGKSRPDMPPRRPCTHRRAGLPPFRKRERCMLF